MNDNYNNQKRKSATGKRGRNPWKEMRPVLFALLFVLLLGLGFYLSGFAKGHYDSAADDSQVLQARRQLESLQERPLPDMESFQSIQAEEEPERQAVDIDALQQELMEHYGEYNYNSEYFRYWFEDAAIVGDSLAETISEFDWIYSQNLQAQIGISLLTCQEVIEGTKWLSPRTIFLTFSANNIAYYGVDIDSYIAEYSALIRNLKESIPGAAIYVEGILPCDPAFSEEYWYYAYLDDYNTAMQQMCEDLDVSYFDAGFILKAHPEIYTEDGLHPLWQFYPLWLTYMARIAGLN